MYNITFFTYFLIILFASLPSYLLIRLLPYLFFIYWFIYSQLIDWKVESFIYLYVQLQIFLLLLFYFFYLILFIT